jgi:hypothetical protein
MSTHTTATESTFTLVGTADLEAAREAFLEALATEGQNPALRAAICHSGMELARRG